eukprot:9338732-Alexandrium_andersonii.AAC.1
MDSAGGCFNGDCKAQPYSLTASGSMGMTVCSPRWSPCQSDPDISISALSRALGLAGMLGEEACVSQHWSVSGVRNGPDSV